MLEIQGPLAVVCHDAGAANLILSWLRRWGGDFRACMQGPAAKLWSTAFPDRPLAPTPGAAMEGAAALLSGTGWASDLEHRARQEASRRKLKSIAVLDHWVNYAERFIRDDTTQWPDELWVADTYAQALARAQFPGLPVRKHPNLYMEEQLALIGPVPGRNRVLYVLEPVRNVWGRSVPGEFQALDYALSHLHRVADPGRFSLTLRPHPSESPDKYAAYADRHPFIEFDRSPSLAAALNEADVVLGVSSFALTVALAAGRRVFSTLPPWAPPLCLPHEGIVQIRNLHLS